mgnify:CR=1 FL=1
MTTHVFIVDLFTFRLHLEYLFAGTGAKEHVVDFNASTATRLHHKTEDTLVGMIADASRIRSGDHIIFYLQQDIKKHVYEGKFYGIFQATQDWSFLDNNDDKQYLKRELNKSLTFRTLIAPYKVYSEGVTEWEALDEIKNIASPNQMLWSLIYRKLKANRGNTMITIYEAERLTQLIRNKNKRSELNCRGKLISFNPTEERIVVDDGGPSPYAGRKEAINILPRLLAKLHSKRAFEPHLQAYITRSLGKGTNSSLDIAILGGAQIEWLGNEVSCGVGMQRIDIMPSVLENGQRVLIPIELKSAEPEEKNVHQIQRYVDWIEQYYVPNRQSDIRPSLLARRTVNKQSNRFLRVVESLKRFNKKNAIRCEPAVFVEFDVDDNDLVFSKVDY